MNSLYIHIPFCRKKCLYCDFYSTRYCYGFARSYIDILCKQIKRLDGDFYTIYIGGGTPTVLEGRLLRKLLKSLYKIARKTVEFSVEANPESLDKQKLKLLLSEGVNRISIGVQSLYDQKLRKLGRIHSAKEALRAVCLAKGEGFKNIGIDLIFGLWQETLSSWKEELSLAVKLPVNHISAYSLTYEKNTPLFDKLNKKKIISLADTITSKMYKYCMDYLPKRGFMQYEVSNFAKNGFFCKHNLNYWENSPYIGLGPSAVSYRGGIRNRNLVNTEKYIEKIEIGKSPIVFQEKLSPEKYAKETAALKIRTKEGINFQWFRKKTGFDFRYFEKSAIKNLITQRLIRYVRVRGKMVGICLTKKGFLFCDSVCAELV